MKKTLEVKETPSIVRHLNINPRVLNYRNSNLWPDLLEVEYDSTIPVPAIVAVSARDLGLQELACVPRT